MLSSIGTSGIVEESPTFRVRFEEELMISENHSLMALRKLFEHKLVVAWDQQFHLMWKTAQLVVEVLDSGEAPAHHADVPAMNEDGHHFR